MQYLIERMISFFERVKRGVKGIRGCFILGKDGTIIDVDSEPFIKEEVLHSIFVLLNSIRALKECEWLMVEGNKAKIIVYEIGGLELGFYCDAVTNPVLLDVAVRKMRLRKLEEQISEHLYQEAKELKDSLKKVARQHMGSAGVALIGKEFHRLTGENPSEVLVDIERQASLLIGPTRASAMRNELEHVIGGNQYD